MSRPRWILAAFVSCLIVVLGALAWVSVVVVSLDRRDVETQRQAELQENIRLALWRMDSALNPIVAQEQTRPFHEYQALYMPPVTLDAAGRPLVGNRVLLPSPLLTQTPPFIKLHFQIDPAGLVASPQATPGATELALAAQNLRVLGFHLDRAVLLAAAPEPETLADHSRRVAAVANAADAEPGATQSQRPDSQQLLEDLNLSNALAQSAMPLDQRQQGRARNVPAQQQLRSDMEYQQRVEANVQSKLLGKFNRSLDNRSQQAPAFNDAPKAGDMPPSGPRPPNAGPAGPLPIEGDMQPMWMGDRLLLVRQVRLGDQVWLQGCWLDWDALRIWLVQRVTDLLPDAELVPAAGSNPLFADPRPAVGGHDRPTPYLLAALPIRLVPGKISDVDESLATPIRTSLIVAWLCAVLALAAVVALVLGMNALSERRAAFVSAVTHELRTPLTTFRMYTEMLAGGMVPDEARRREYLLTLRSESDRLAQLIENVLSYARLERGRAATHTEAVTVEQLLDRLRGRLRPRAHQAEMELDLVIGDSLGDATVRTDVAAVEQIVANLVDNACKYAAGAEDRRIHVRAQSDARWLRLRVADHGPGVATDAARRLFRPFHRSAQDAANSAPGVGLGLALSRRLARRLRGDLILVSSDDAGACFELKLPVR
jgi:signal transduction histidine kinase